MKTTYHIGIDLHAKTAAIAWASSCGKLEYHGSCSTTKSTERTLRELAKSFGVPFKDLRVCYEAGPTGFFLARRLSGLGDLRRFEHPRQLMVFLGLVPGEHSSGSKRRLGAITKCGNSHARWMLVESAKAYRTRPNVSAQLTTRQDGLPREVKVISRKAQNRLCTRYRRLKARGLHENKAAIAVAREPTGFLWELHHLQHDA